MNKIRLLALSSMTMFLVLLSATSVKAEERSRTIRVTSGSYQISGWQNELIKGDPSLAHWTWLPIVGYKQSTMQVGQSQGYVRPKQVYSKPSKITTVLPKYKYNKPLHIAAGALQASMKDVKATISTAQPQEKAAVYCDVNSTYSGQNQNVECNVLGKVMQQASKGHVNRLSF